MIDHLTQSIESNFLKCLQLLLDKCESDIERIFLLKIIDFVLKLPDRYSFGFVFEETDTEMANGVEVVAPETNYLLNGGGFGNLCGFRIYNLIHQSYFEIFPQMKIKFSDPSNALQSINYRLDFGIHKYSIEIPNVMIKKYCVECDGFDFHNTKNQIKKDNQRTRDLMLLNDITTIRYLGTEIYNMTDGEVSLFIWNL